MLEHFKENYEQYPIPQVYAEREYEKGNLYYLFNCGKLVYIGQTVDLKNRIYNHLQTKQFDTVFKKEYPYQELLDIERAEIRKYFPVYNSQYIARSDYSNPLCEFFVEFDDYYIIRTYGKVLKSDIIIKDGIGLLRRGDNKPVQYQFIDFNNKKIGKWQILVNRFDYAKLIYNEEKHCYEFKEVEPPLPVYKEVKYKPAKVQYQSTNKLKYNINEVRIDENYIFPVGKYKHQRYKYVKDDNYKRWYYENVYLKK